ncbi:hypothetical protein [uncultured Pseudomonas sp.]|uniref:hypothetical protein n=1 Tax=uncultured Pseudomonas sp. TaxID=114707 RepID=UPI0025EEBD79|nr:hypothetical protein [uncultured Pseudomonas sp.]
MSNNKLAEYFAQLEVRIRGLRQLEKVQSSLDAIASKSGAVQASLDKASKSIVSSQSKIDQAGKKSVATAKSNSKGYADALKQQAKAAEEAARRIQAIQSRHINSNRVQRVRSQLVSAANTIKPRLRVNADGVVTSPPSKFEEKKQELIGRIRRQSNSQFSVFANRENALAGIRDKLKAEEQKIAASAIAQTKATEKARQEYYAKAQAQYIRDMDRFTHQDELNKAKAQRQAEGEARRQQQAQRIALQIEREKNKLALQSAAIASAEARQRLQGIRENAARLSAARQLSKGRAKAQQETLRQSILASRLQATQARTQATLTRIQESAAIRQARQASSSLQESGNSFFGPISGPVAGVAAAGYIAQQVVSALQERVQKRQEGADVSEQTSNVFAAAASKDPGKESFIKDVFYRMSNKFGISNDIDSAKDYRNFILAQRGRGENLDNALNTYIRQNMAFRGAGMTQEEMKRANLQLGQIRSKGYGDREDLNTFTEAAPILRTYVEQAWAQRNKFKGNDQQRAAAVTNSTGKHNLLAVDFNEALKLYVAQNKEVIARQSSSIQANQQRTENAQREQAIAINSDPELVKAVNENIIAHQRLTEAMLPVNQALEKFDTVLTNISATLLGSLTGKLKETPTGNLSFGADAGVAIDPQALMGRTPTSDDMMPRDTMWDWLLGHKETGAFNPQAQDMMRQLSSPSYKLEMSEKMLDRMGAPATTTTNNDNRQIQVGNIVISSSDPQATAQEVKTQLNGLWNLTISNFAEVVP